MKTCQQCQSPFEVTDKDRVFYKKVDVSEPLKCPTCRQQSRLLWGNQMNLYKRKCDATGQDIVSVYEENSPLKIYHQKYWWSDEWDALQYGREFDFTRPFFEQWAELAFVCPRPALFTSFEFDENAEYTNHAGKNKNCYMIFDSDYSQDCYYSLGVNHSKNCMDCYRVKDSELCYECVDCFRCYGVYYSQDSENCSNSAFLKNCIGVKNSFMCSNLKNKEYWVYNQPSDKATVERLMANLSKASELKKYQEEWDRFKLRYPQKFIHGVQNENVTGDYLVQCKDAEVCFDSMNLWDCKYFTRAFGEAKDCMDCDECGDKIELYYNSAISGYNSSNLRMCLCCFNQSSDLTYCYYTMSSKNCFGCVSLNRKEYCILNKQYSKEDYEALVPKIIEHMKQTGEWGDFFPAQFSDFAYNETVAQEYYPLTQEQALTRGYRWRAFDQKEHLPATFVVPDDLEGVTAEICKELLSCVTCGKNYKIIPQEFEFYKKSNLKLPKNCFSCRHQARFNLRNPRHLVDRQCAQCQVSINTTYSLEQDAIVYCEDCYQKSLI